MPKTHRILALAPLIVAACFATPNELGYETSACYEGRCADGLMCLSDVCVDPMSELDTDGADDSSTGETDASTPAEPSFELDVLFVLDNSGSMAEEQANLTQHIDSLLSPLVGAGFRVRTAITTTDNGNYWCEGSGVGPPESGHFVLSSCQSRLSDFYFAGAQTDAESSCTETCPLEEIVISPTATALDPTPSARPWLEISQEGTNVGAEQSLTDVLQCALPQGINGCGFESPMEAMRNALELSAQPGQPESGFVRETAHLAVVFVTDEADCSFNPMFQDTVFGERNVGNQAFWSLPDVQQSPTSAVCWNAGVSCDYSLDGEQCRTEDKDVEGAPAREENAVLHPVEQYRAQLAELRTDKQSFGAGVFVFGIVGVPASYSSGETLTYALGPDASELESFQARFGVAAGCASRTAQAVPPVRLRSLVEDSPWGSNGQLYSVCDADYSNTLSSIADRIIGYTP